MENQIINLVRSHVAEEDFLMGNVMLEVLGLTSILKGDEYPEEDNISVDCVIQTAKTSQLTQQTDETSEPMDPTKYINDFLESLKNAVTSEKIIKGAIQQRDHFGPRDFDFDMVKNCLTKSHFYTVYNVHMSNKNWDSLCSHFS